MASRKKRATASAEVKMSARMDTLALLERPNQGGMFHALPRLVGVATFGITSASSAQVPGGGPDLDPAPGGYRHRAGSGRRKSGVGSRSGHVVGSEGVAGTPALAGKLLMRRGLAGKCEGKPGGRPIGYPRARNRGR
jgi:hypothetical protein